MKTEKCMKQLAVTTFKHCLSSLPSCWITQLLLKEIAAAAAELCYKLGHLRNCWIADLKQVIAREL